MGAGEIQLVRQTTLLDHMGRVREYCGERGDCVQKRQVDNSPGGLTTVLWREKFGEGL